MSKLINQLIIKQALRTRHRLGEPFGCEGRKQVLGKTAVFLSSDKECMNQALQGL